MGMEDFGKKPVVQGEAGFLTQEQLDEMNGTPAHAETAKAEAPAEGAVVSPEKIATVTESPEEKAEALQRAQEVRERLSVAQPEKQNPIEELKNQTIEAHSKKGVAEASRRSEASKLLDSFNLPEKGFFSKSRVREKLAEEGIERALLRGLNSERSINAEREENAVNAVAISTIGSFVVTAGGSLAYAVATGSALALGTVTLPVTLGVAGAGAVGWLGYKIYHGIKQRAHRKKFNKLYPNGRQLRSAHINYS